MIAPAGDHLLKPPSQAVLHVPVTSASRDLLGRGEETNGGIPLLPCPAPQIARGFSSSKCARPTSSLYVHNLHHHSVVSIYTTFFTSACSPETFACPPLSPRNIINKSQGRIQLLVCDAGKDLELLQRHTALAGHRILPVPCTRIYAGETCGNQTEPFPTSSAKQA